MSNHVSEGDTCTREEIPLPVPSPSFSINSRQKTELHSSSSPTLIPSDTSLTPLIGTISKASTPPSDSIPVVIHSKKGRSSSVQLIDDLPVTRTEALASFNEIIENSYQYKTLGRSREALESMTCDCVYEDGIHDESVACGPESDCINRLTQVECLPDDCRCGSRCQNQRFQKRQYTEIEIVLTEKKGYGLRAESDISKDTFIYEYVGEVVSLISFKKRMRDYAAEGIQHFYFMMLQKDEFIDATKTGGIGRFANHSCKPNCYVAKWTVGQYIRMGIFAKRNIRKHEELTFNYNVDRYGHQAQNCYCGELNCLGYIGGKTQTDMATVDDLYLDALGITDEADLMELKGSKKRKGKKIDDPDFMPTLKPLVEKDVPKIVQAVRQTQSRKMLLKFLTRIRITEDQAALRQIMRLRGYSVMTNVLEDHATDLEMFSLVLECIKNWPLLNRNKVEDSKIATPIQALLAKEDLPEELRGLGDFLLEHWNSLPLYNRISKRLQADQEETSWQLYAPNDEPDSKRSKLSKFEDTELKLLPPRPVWITHHNLSPPSPEPQIQIQKAPKRELAQAVIAMATAKKAAEDQEVAEAAKEAAAAEAEKKAKLAEQEERRRLKAEKKAKTHQEKEMNKEKRLQKLVGAVVVKCMSTYATWMGHDMFKKHARALTQKICDSEKNTPKYQESKLDALSDEKVKKIRKYAKEYIQKLHHKMKNSGQRSHTSYTAAETPSTSTTTPTSLNGVDVVMADISMDDILDTREDTPEVNGSKVEDDTFAYFPEEGKVSPPLNPVPLGPSDSDASVMEFDAQEHFNAQISSDPRRRPPVGEMELLPT